MNKYGYFDSFGKGPVMNGLTGREMTKLARLHGLAERDLAVAKREASEWCAANRRRRVIRRAACRTVRGLFSEMKP